jgi:SAM-dependent methyltransferase
MTGTTTDLSRPRFARMYLRISKNAEARGATQHRRRLLDGLHGAVLELGAGHGLNFPHYPAGVSEVIAIEPEPTLRARAADAAASAPVRVRVLAGVADELPVADQSVDAAIASLVLCSVPDQRRALAELRRVSCAPAASCGSTNTSFPAANQSASYSRPPTTAACGRRSPAAATPRATPPPRSSRPAFRSSQASGSCSPPRLSSRGSPTSSAWRDEPDGPYVRTPVRTYVVASAYDDRPGAM